MAWRNDGRHRNFGPIEARPGTALEPLMKLVRELEANAPWIHAQHVRVEWVAAGSTVALVSHQLGRPYQDGWVGAVSAMGHAASLLTPEGTLALGGDPAKVAAVQLVTAMSGIDATAGVWVF